VKSVGIEIMSLEEEQGSRIRCSCTKELVNFYKATEEHVFSFTLARFETINCFLETL
jgi:hypothetical protein